MFFHNKDNFLNSRTSNCEKEFFSKFLSFDPVPCMNSDGGNNRSRTVMNTMDLAERTIIGFDLTFRVCQGTFEYHCFEFDCLWHDQRDDPIRLCIRGILELGMNPRAIVRLLAGDIFIADGHNPTVTYVYLIRNDDGSPNPLVLVLGRIVIVELPPQSTWPRTGLGEILGCSYLTIKDGDALLRSLFRNIHARGRSINTFAFRALRPS